MHTHTNAHTYARTYTHTNTQTLVTLCCERKMVLIIAIEQCEDPDSEGPKYQRMNIEFNGTFK